MAKVFFKEFEESHDAESRSKTAADVLAHIVEEENIQLNKTVPLKVHFGEAGNTSFIKSENYQGIIDYLKEKQVEPSYIETNVLYSGKRRTASEHIETAHKHGFTGLPITIADGELGDECNEIDINKKHFKSCRVGKGFSDYDQFIILSHFKGHRMAGFGGAIKQLGMGFASKAGKLAQHATSRPIIIPFLCKKCGACARYCPVGAIKTGLFYRIDKTKCTGCAGCVSSCPKNAILPNFLASFSQSFIERLVEYAYAGQLNKKNIYISFAMSMTKYCDCEGRKMKPIIEDLGVFASTDPISVDKACLDLIDERNKKTVYPKGRHALDYGEEIGLGSTQYELITL